MSTAYSYNNIENELQTYYKPIQPRMDFVKHLRRRLTTQSSVILERRSSGSALFVILACFLGGVFLFMMIRRL